MGFLSALIGNASEVDASKLDKEFSELLIDGEEIQHAYKLFRDLIVFTNFRLFLVNKQGMTGKKREYTCVPYKSIDYFTKETAGHFDLDAIVIEEMRTSEWYYKVWQSFAVLLPVRSVGVMGDERTYDYTIALRIVSSHDGMTADWVRMPQEILARISARVINEVKGVNRVCYDISSKPPATIEWE
jgi:hypothetical protein